MGILIRGCIRRPNRIINSRVQMYGSGHAGVTGQNIPPAELYPDILWPRPIYTPGYSVA